MERHVKGTCSASLHGASGWDHETMIRTGLLDTLDSGYARNSKRGVEFGREREARTWTLHGWRRRVPILQFEKVELTPTKSWSCARHVRQPPQYHLRA